MTEPPQYPSAPDPNLPPSAATPPPTPPYGGYGTPPGTPPPPAPPAYGVPGGPQGGPPAYDVMAAVSYGWRAFKANVGTFLLLGILAMLVPGLISGIGQVASQGGSALAEGSDGAMLALGVGGGILGILLNIVSQVVALFFTAASIRAAFDVTEGRRAELGAAFSRWSMGQVIVLALLVAIGTMVGLLLCVLPGIVFIFFTWFGTYFVVGNGQSGFEAIGSSFRFTADNLGNLLLLFLMAVLIALLGLLACFVGLLVAMPVLTVAAAYTFRVLQGQPVAAV